MCELALWPIGAQENEGGASGHEYKQSIAAGPVALLALKRRSHIGVGVVLVLFETLREGVGYCLWLAISAP